MQNSTPHIRKSQPVAGLSFCLLSQEQIVQSVMSLAPEDEALRLVVTTNVDHMVTMRRQPEFKHACEHAWLVTADGFPVVSLLKALNIATPGRITGADLFPAILASLSPVWHSPFFVCASEATADYLRCWLAGRGYTNPDQRVIVPEFGFEKDALRSSEILTQIQAVGTTHLFFGVGAPKSELWMQKHRAQLTGMYGFGFGAGLENLLTEPNTVATRSRIQELVADALKRWEDRIVVDGIAVDPVSDAATGVPDGVRVEIAYRLLRTGAPARVGLTLVMEARSAH